MQTKSDEKLAFWRRKVEEYRASGLSRPAFCRRKGIKKSSLDYWFTRIRKAEPESGFVEVKVTTAPPSPQLELLVADRFRIRLQSGFDPGLLAQVVKALETLA